VTDAALRDLYYDWEQNQWAAGAIDLQPDGSVWSDLEPRVRSLLLEGFACSALAAERVARDLGPLIDAAPTEEQQVFLTTQLVDAARHVVLFDLIRTQVLGGSETQHATPVPDGFQKLVSEQIPHAIAVVSRTGDRAGWEDAVGLVNLGMIEANLHPVQTKMARLAGGRGLTGCAKGLSATARDLERHARFAGAVLA
jgi:hypothetical protein